MQKILGFFKNKSVGYYIAAGITLLALVVSIVFFATYKNPALDPIFHNNPMGNKADGLYAVTIGIFLLAGVVVELVVLIIPQYRFIQIIAIAMFGLALYKDVMIIPDFFAGIINNVMYNGGNLGLNMFFFISLLVIVILAIVVAFLGFYKDEEQAKADMKNIKGPVNLAKLGGGAALVLAAVLASSLTVAGMTKGTTADKKNAARPKPAFVFAPITDDVSAAAEAYDYSFEAKDVVIKQQESYNFSSSELSGMTYGNTRADHYLVYVFEGAYAEGYQGDYSETYADIYLWDDGLFGGKVNDTNIKGYWYNSSLNAAADEQDCLNLVSNVNRYESIICAPAQGFYEWRAHIYLGFSWGTRSMEVSAYRYYPEVSLAIDASVGNNYFFVGEEFDRDGWVANRILKNLNYSAVFKASQVTWTDGEGIKNHQVFEEAGEYEVKASWKNGYNETFEASITVTVVD